uniref:Phenylalanine-tRNA ligase beta subunit n=1 Tax=Lophurella stichidiosa TaxID=2008659 RepID=UPI002551ECF4|nr:Phenylalanine-tRNA ligase beta subunit [Aphanocladia stichidiosa]WGH13897.1 Phenylalanine-tRNA ligase beta subunit [Aphanocladia stichidiosa]
MKFSLQLINNFTNLDHIDFNQFKENLTLSGLEIENIESTDKYKDKIIDLSITANREEIRSSLSLAIETSTIFNTALKIIPIPLKYKQSIKYNDRTSKNKKFTHIAYIRIITLKEIITKTTPKWLLNQLKTHQINEKDILNNIKEYIKIKWGRSFDITNYNKIQQQKNIIQNSNSIKLFNTKNIDLILKSNINTNKSDINKLNILIFTTINKIENTNFINYELSEFYENMFIDSIKLITTIIGGTIPKYNHAHEKIFIKENKLKIRKKSINKSLGYIQGKQLQFINTQNITNILKQLKLHPIYNKKNKSFEITIPSYRKHDLKREIDIIEEIGRIYKFKYFFNKIQKSSTQGWKSKTHIKVKHIKNTLRRLGLHEVINCCIHNNINNNFTNAKIHNPITNTQQELRRNILENLINNYEHNIKYSKNNIEIFEIGKIFERDNSSKNNYIEKRHLSGLIHNTRYTRSNWNNDEKNITIFHFKNIIETFLETINSRAILKEKLLDNEEKDLNYPEYLLKTNKQINIYDPKTKTIIGIIGELNKQYVTKSNYKNNNIYVFEINLNKLIETTKSINHLVYTSQQYSNYPSVTRDISIKLKKYVKIETIKETILKGNKELIESINVFNEYSTHHNINHNTIRYVGLRIIYRSNKRTLNNKDIMHIDTNLEHKLQKLQEI